MNFNQDAQGFSILMGAVAYYQPFAVHCYWIPSIGVAVARSLIKVDILSISSTSFTYLFVCFYVFFFKKKSLWPISVI